MANVSALQPLLHLLIEYAKVSELFVPSMEVMVRVAEFAWPRMRFHLDEVLIGICESFSACSDSKMGEVVAALFVRLQLSCDSDAWTNRTQLVRKYDPRLARLLPMI